MVNIRKILGLEREIRMFGLCDEINTSNVEARKNFEGPIIVNETQRRKLFSKHWHGVPGTRTYGEKGKSK